MSIAIREKAEQDILNCVAYIIDREAGLPGQQARIDSLREFTRSQQSHIDRLEAENKHLNIRCSDLWDYIKELEAKKAELLGATKHLLEQFQKWEGYHQWDEEDEEALQSGRAIIAKTGSPTEGEQG